MRQASLLHILQGLLLLACLVSVPVACFQPAPGCPNMCGNVSIPYPFGIGDDCTKQLELGGDFYVTCNETFQPPRPFLGKEAQVEIIDISLERGEVRVHGPMSHRCFSSTDSITSFSNWHWNLSSGSPCLPSPSRNKFVAIGCNTLAYFGGQTSNQLNGDQRVAIGYYTGCVSNCRGGVESAAVDGAPCTGMGCCEASIPNGLGYMKFSWGYNTSYAWNFSPCSYAMLAEEGWYNFSRQDLLGYLGYFNRTGEWSVPFVLDWAIRNGSCPQGDQKKPDNFACVSKNSNCVHATNGLGYLCHCSQGYQGNPYILDGCQDIDECNLPELYPCKRGKCLNTLGSYECKCNFRMKGDGKSAAGCEGLIVGLIIGLGVGSGVGFLFLVLAAVFITRKLKVQRAKKLRAKFFKQNRGLLLQQLVDKDIAERMMFSLQELEKATNKFDEARKLGGGGHGTVYKGILSDQHVVAIKKSKVVIRREIDEFINEVAILSQINHRNVVKMFGCCLETEVPLLVYEFISNGTLYDHLHVEGPESLSWEDRLRIALETARALAYLHSAASTSIIHRDIKSANILLDDCLTAKVSDFGASRGIAIDQTGVTTTIQGTFGYLDPEYYYTSRLTEKSDVYSFGAVLVELLTGKKPSSVHESPEGVGLIAHFILLMRQDKLFDMLDPQVAEEGGREAKEVAAIAAMCLSLKGEERPMMRQVEMRLEELQGSRNHLPRSLTAQRFEESQIVQNHPSMEGSNDNTSRHYSTEVEVLFSAQYPR